MALLCNYCATNQEINATIPLINEESQKKLENENAERLSKSNSINSISKNLNQKKLFYKNSNDFSPEKDDKGNSIFEIKMPYICLFCGGKTCKYENPSNMIKSDLKGIIANLYRDCVYASQRPCTKLIEENNLIEVFKQNKIKLIINCQINGEHPFCGPNNGLEKDCGFSYSPSIFVSEGIEVLNKGFPDMKRPETFDFMLDIVKKMAYVVKYKKGRVLVHCHAGNGRTGIVNACFFIYYFNLTWEEAKIELRKLRPKAVEKPIQEIYCEKFGEFIIDAKNLFPKKIKNIRDFIRNQNIMDFNFDKEKFGIPSIVVSYYLKNNDKNITNKKGIYSKIIDINFIPKIIFECIEKIIEQKLINKINIKELYDILNGKKEINEEINKIDEIIFQLKNYNWEFFEKEEDINIISEILFLWLNEHVLFCISPQNIINIINSIINSPEKKEILKNEEDEESSNKGMRINVQKLYEKYINKMEYKNEIKDILVTIKNNLTKVEYELIKYLSVFLQIIYPTNNIPEDSNIQNDDKTFENELIKEYKRFLYKLNLFLLGYNLDKSNSNPDYISPGNELLHAQMLSFIFELFIFYYNESTELEINPEEDIFFIYKNRSHFKSINNFL